MKRGQVIALGVAGFVIGWTPIFAFIHELGHAVVALLDPNVQLIGPGFFHTEFYGEYSKLLLASGFATDAAVGIWIAVLAIRRWMFGLAAFCLGHTMSVPLFAAGSTDYQKMAEEFGISAAIGTWTLFAIVTVIMTLAVSSVMHQELNRKRSSDVRKAKPMPKPTPKLSGSRKGEHQ